MTLSLKVVLIVISILTCFYIARKLRKSQMNINVSVLEDKLRNLTEEIAVRNNMSEKK